MSSTTIRPAPRRTARAWAAAALTLAAVALTAPAASAHDRLVGSDPEAGAVLDAVPAQVVLTFSAAVQELGTTLELQDAGGALASDAETQVDGSEVALPLPSDLAAGDYTLVYRVTSSDGHPVNGEVPFTVDVAAAATSAPAPTGASTAPTTAAPSTGASAPTAEPSPSASAGAAVADDADPAAATTDGDFPWVPVLVVVLVLALGGLAAGVLARRRGASR